MVAFIKCAGMVAVLPCCCVWPVSQVARKTELHLRNNLTLYGTVNSSEIYFTRQHCYSNNIRHEVDCKSAQRLTANIQGVSHHNRAHCVHISWSPTTVVCLWLLISQLRVESHTGHWRSDGDRGASLLVCTSIALYWSHLL